MSGAATETSLGTRLAAVCERVGRAAELAGRDPGEITVVGVTKTVGRDAVDRAYDLGMRVFGENRVQDTKVKFVTPLPDDAELHMIGSLQSNKARSAVELFDVIQSVDRRSLVDALAKQAAVLDKDVRVLLEINVAAEEQKAGCPLAEAQQLFELVLSQPRIQPIGLMTMAPLAEDQSLVRPIFSQLRELGLRLRMQYDVALPVLSMGMSNDFEVAIAEGSTHVRIGRAIFGG